MIKKSMIVAALVMGAGCVVTYTEPVVRVQSYPVEQQVVVSTPAVVVDEWVVYEPIWPIGYYEVFFYGGRRCYRLRPEYHHHEITHREQVRHEQSRGDSHNGNRNDSHNGNRNDSHNDNRKDNRKDNRNNQ